MKEKTMNMTKGNITKLLIFFSIPMLIGNVFQQLYNLVDSVVVGRLVGADALAAIGATGSITFLFFALCNGIGSGGGIVTAQYFGSGDEKLVKSCIANTAYIMVVIPIVVGVAAFFLAKPLLEVLQTPDAIMKDALLYVKVMCIGLVFVSMYNYISSMLRALGDSKTPLYFLVFACLLNTVLDIVFVKYLKMSVWGAAIATLIAQFVSGMACLWYAVMHNPYFKLNKEDMKVNPPVIAAAVRMGVPLSLQFSLIAISTMALQRVVNSFGAITVAAFTAGSRIEQVIHQPYQTLGTALATYTGQNYGARKTERVFLGYRKSMRIMFVFTVIMVLFMQLFPRQITGWFVTEARVIDMGAKSLRITSLFYVFLGIIYMVRGVLNGVGDAFFAMYNGVVEVIGRFTIPVLLTMLPFVGVWGIWWSVGIVWFISGFTAWLRYRKFRRKMINNET